MKKNAFLILIMQYLLCCCLPSATIAQAPDLGKVSGFTLFTAVGAVTNTGATYLHGNIGTNAGAFSGFPPGILKGNIHVADNLSTLAATEAAVVYNYLNAMTCGTVIGTTLGYNQVLGAGVYCTGAASSLNGTLTLDGQGNPDALFIIKINGAFTTGVSSIISLINGAALINVYWQVNGQFDLGDSSVFKGTLMANGAINLLDKASFYGRAISVAGAISLHNNIIAAPNDVYLKTTAYSVTDTTAWTYNRYGNSGNDFAGNMDDENLIWHLQNVSVAEEDSPWVMGNNARILLGDSIHAIRFTINKDADLFGLLETVNSNATLIIKSDSIPYLNSAKKNSTVNYSKNGNQQIRPCTYGNLIVSDSGTKTLLNTTIVNNKLTIQSGTLAIAANHLSLGVLASAEIGEEGILSIDNSAAIVDFNNRPVTLKSTSTGSAIISTIQGSLINATAVTVERYLQDKRAWRMLTTPLYSSSKGDLFSNWMENGSTSASYGTLITCPTTYANAMTGMDTAPNNNYSFLYWGGSSWIGVRDAKSTNTLMNSVSTSGAIPFCLFSRGDRTISATNASYGHSATTLRSTGTLITGNIIYNSFGYSKGWSSTSYSPINGGYVLIANPYPSPVSLDKVYTASTNINRTFWIWDPTIATTGAYVTINWNGQGYTIAGGATNQNEYLQSGQAVFVEANAAYPSVVFTEECKTTNQLKGVFGNNNVMGQLSVDLKLVNDSVNNITHSEDGLVMLFNNNFSVIASDAADAIKFVNKEESISCVAGNNNLSIDALPFPAQGDTIKLNSVGMKMDTSYNLIFTPLNLSSTGVKAVLYDRYKQSKIPVSLSTVSTINFKVLSTATSSYAADRFAFIFVGINDTILPVSFISINGSLVQNKVLLDWTVSSQINVLSYIIEKSVDGLMFQQVAVLPANNSLITNYSFKDNYVSGLNYYRIKVISSDGSNSYSKVIVVNDFVTKDDFVIVSSNPTNSSSIQLQLNADKGRYKFTLTNMLGEVVMMKNISYSGGKQSLVLKMNNIMPAGIYQLLVKNDTKESTIQIIINSQK